ncbi:MAG: DUF2845 domain-containing protein [Burkholderiaceae bacterium]
MKSAVPLAFAILAAALLLPASAGAQSFRCANKDLVSVGDSRTTVLLRCGEPVLKDSFCKAIDPSEVARLRAGAPARRVPACDAVEEWTYNPGYGQFWTTLQFENGSLRSIKYGDWVK